MFVKAVTGNKRGPDHCRRLCIKSCRHSQEAGTGSNAPFADYFAYTARSNERFIKGDDKRKKQNELALRKMSGSLGRRERGGGGETTDKEWGGGGRRQRVGWRGEGSKGFLLHRQYGKSTSAGLPIFQQLM